MKQKIQDLILSAAKSAFEKGDLPSADIDEVEVEEPLLLAEVQENVPVAAEVEDPTDASAARPRPLTRIVAESIDLDAEVVPVGWDILPFKLPRIQGQSYSQP